MKKPNSPNTSERLTRKHLIDPMLQRAGWKIAAFEQGKDLSEYNNCAIEEYPTEAGPADYALCVDGSILGVVEAKKLTLGPQSVLTQAERYSKGLTTSPLNYHGYRVPFLYATNGEVLWHHDVRPEKSRSRKIAQFHNPEALRERFAQKFDEICSALLQLPNDSSRLRPYQFEANEAVERAIADHKRHMLVAMATGTGKTFTTVNQIYRLMKSGAAKRVLFLVDRRSLAAQTVRAFSAYDAEPGLKFNQVYETYSQRFQKEDFGEEEKFDPKVLPNGHLTNPKPGHAFVYVSTIQRMAMNLFGKDAVFETEDSNEDDIETLDIPIHAFDLIVADECHRGYTSSEVAVWRKTLDHFDAIKVGLTATPASHTIGYFIEKVYEYPYSRAVREGYLVDYDVVTIKSDVRMQGVFLQEGEQIALVDPESGAEQMDLLEDERKYDSTDIERKVTAPDSNRKTLEEIRKYAIEHEERFGRFPKILIFAVNDLPHTSHADQLVDIARDVFGQGDSFVQKITGRVDRPLQRIREFRNRENPKIVVSVDMLTTGVDIPDLEFIVFLRPVKSRILFEQMVGRGTRKGERFPDKSHFVVVDCFDGTLLKYFKQATGITADPPLREGLTIPQLIEHIWENKDRDYKIRCLVKRLQRIDKEMTGEGRELFAKYVPQGDLASFARELPESFKVKFTQTMELLRDEQFQKLLQNYPRPKRVFVVASDTEDTVSSMWLVRGLDGQEYKPDDYLIAFAKYVQENPEHIDAIKILLDHPTDWNSDALKELKTKLAATEQRFTLENLQKAHEITHHKALIEIISMIKYAADEHQPLYTARERVQRAFEEVTNGKKFTFEQQQWLERIKDHLIENLSVEKDDFELVPLFVQFGGWNKANRTFDNKLEPLLHAFNSTIAK